MPHALHSAHQNWRHGCRRDAGNKLGLDGVSEVSEGKRNSLKQQGQDKVTSAGGQGLERVDAAVTQQKG
jgi:hypothetical protein